ncbi:hypothetical protein B5X24_HaOG207723 [Helicoverpa armigera]|uniref:Uncharacterized protein n=1 Tax=Helicoverpa armigera TaxID=29058 RepID=A0A2W1BHG4_HELAM|nr:hypothetical protein B5X24_HaOG207723 [Helicoverpa armigera]
MRNAFVVLVSLCIGVVSGFIVPRSVSEDESTTKSSNVTTTDKEDVTSTTTSFPSKFSVLPNSRSDIDEKDLYEHATEKQKNQSERAFIYINQIYKKPVRNKIFKVLPLDNKPELVRVVVTPPPAPPAPPQTPCPSTFDSLGHANTYFPGYDFSDKPQDMASYFAAPSIFRCNFKENAKKNIDLTRSKSLPQVSNRIDERRDYFELLKPPILRPVSRINTKSTYDIINQNDFGSLSPSNSPYKDSYLKKYNLKNPYLSKANVAILRQDEFRKNYGFHGDYARRNFQSNKDSVNRVEDVNFEGDFINEDDTHRLLTDNQEEDKLLDKYLKDTLEEQITGSDKGSMPECSYRECILQGTKQYTNNGLLIKPDCRCGKRHNAKQLDPFARDRPLREEAKRNETGKSSEMNYYEDLLSGEAALIRQDDDVIRPPHRYNDTGLI